VYIKTTKNSAGQGYYHVVESYWFEGKSRQRVLLSLGRVGGEGEDRLDELAAAISKFRDTLTVTQLAKEISIEKTFILGPLLVLEKLFSLLGLDELMQVLASKHSQLEIDLRAVIFTIIACRFVKPGSKLKIFEHGQKLLYPEMVDEEMPLHHLYRALDLLADHKEEIEERLYWRGRDLFSEATDIVLYDLTTLRFESTEQTEELRRFGYSKEMRSDCTQVIFGLLLSTAGIPLGFEVYPGNTFEGATLSGIVEKMRKKFRIRRMIFVADRGLFSSKNLEILKQDGGEFIVGCKLWSSKNIKQEEFCDLKKFKWILPGELAILETKTDEGDRLIITWSIVRATRDKKTRDDILEKIKKKFLSKKKVSTKEFVTNTNYKKYFKGLDAGSPELNKDVIEAEAKRDGFFGIVTNVKEISAEDAVTNYKELWKIEDAFGEIKGTLKTRPVFHWTDHRIIGHLTACFLAYLCEAHITRLLREKKLKLKSPALKTDGGPLKDRALTVPEALKELNEVRAVPVKIRGQEIWCRTDIAGNSATLLHAIGARIPPKILKINTNPAGTNKD
jgi:transposase